MGKSKSITDVQKDNTDFQKFLEEIQKGLKAKAEIEAKDFEKKVTEFYKDKKIDYTILAEGEKYDYTLTSEMGVSTLKNTIGNMVNALFGLADQSKKGEVVIDKTENGSVVSNVTDEVMNSIKLILVYRNMAAAVVTNLMTELLGIFSTKLEVKSSHNYAAEAIAPGLRLHIDVYADSCVSEQFFKNDSIIENYMRFQLIYSSKLAQLEGNMYTQLILEARKTKLAKAMSAFDDTLLEMTMNPETSTELLSIYIQRSDLLHQYYNSAVEDIKNLIAQFTNKNSALSERERLQRKVLETIGH